MKQQRWSLNKKLILCFVCFGMTPVLILGWITLEATRKLIDDTGKSYETIAAGVTDRIDRNLFERYGDVQAFGANTAVEDRAAWYKVGAKDNRIAAAINTYVKLYGCYRLSLLVDLKGRLIAVNDCDADGKPLATTALYQRDYSQASWFKATLAGEFLKSSTLDGTHVEDLRIDDEVRTVCGTDGLVLGFSAPVRNAQGEVVAIWNNRADFSLVEEIVASTYRELKAMGLGSAELTLIDRAGRVLVDYDPKRDSGNEAVRRDLKVLLSLNLAEKGVAAAAALVAGRSGSGRAFHVRKEIWQTAGYRLSSGALGFPGLKWGMIVRVDEKESLAGPNAIRRKVYVVAGASLFLLCGVAWWMGRAISRPLTASIRVLEQMGAQVTAAAGQISGASQNLATGASEQAASLEETGATLEEIASMTKHNDGHAASAKDLARQTRTAADAGVAEMDSMSRAMSEIKNASDNIAKIIKTIDEIAFQTNILALNAAVEAARAGEAGMGFGVVAEEVRNLAQRCAQAARETTTKIEDSMQKSELGVKFSAQVGRSLQEILSRAREMDEVVAQIVTASREQSQGVEQVNTAVAQMDKITQSNAAHAEETASAAEELNAQSAELKNAVGSLIELVGVEATADPDEPSDAAPARAPVERTRPESSFRNAVQPSRPAHRQRELEHAGRE